MTMQILHANVVVAAQFFNPSIFSQLWLVRNEVATEEDFQGEFIYTPNFVQLRTSGFVLLVLPEQLQFAPLSQGKASSMITERVGKIVKLLPETPYIAVGLNFTWQLVPTGDVADFGRTLFWRSNPLYDFFAEKDARFGGYLSKDTMNVRLKLDVKPVKATQADGVDDRLVFAFNYHQDLLNKTDAVSEMERVLQLWDKAESQSREIVATVESWRWK